jgi:hypothetical protein
MPGIEGSIDVTVVGDDTYSLIVAVALGGRGRPTTIAGLRNVDIVLRAVGVPVAARAKALDGVKANGAGSTGVVQLHGEALRRLGLM